MQPCFPSDFLGASAASTLGGNLCYRDNIAASARGSYAWLRAGKPRQHLYRRNRRAWHPRRRFWKFCNVYRRHSLLETSAKANFGDVDVCFCKRANRARLPADYLAVDGILHYTIYRYRAGRLLYMDVSFRASFNRNRRGNRNFCAWSADSQSAIETFQRKRASSLDNHFKVRLRSRRSQRALFRKYRLLGAPNLRF